MQGFAVRRGEVKNKSLACSPFTPLLIELLHDWSRSRWYQGELTHWVHINPRTDLSLLPNDKVSFVPMEAVGEKDGNIELQTESYAEVAQGYTRFAENDLLWAKITPCMQNGKSAVVRGLRNGVGFGSTEFHVIRPKTEDVLVDFLWAVFTLDTFLSAAQAAFTGSAGQQRVPDSFLKSLPVPIPPRHVQQAMMAELEAARTTRQHKLAEADALLGGLDAYVLEQLGLAVPEVDEGRVYAVNLQRMRNVRLDADFHNPAFRKLSKVLQAATSSPLGDLVQFSKELWNPNTTIADTFCYIEISCVNTQTGEVAPVETAGINTCSLSPYLPVRYRP